MGKNMGKTKRFHIDERYVTVNLTMSIILYAMVVPFCIYLSVDNFIHGKPLVAGYALFCATMTAIATICFAVCKFGKKRRRWLMHLAINIQCFVYWITLPSSSIQEARAVRVSSCSSWPYRSSSISLICLMVFTSTWSSS